jgi:beta-lactamase class A
MSPAILILALAALLQAGGAGAPDSPKRAEMDRCIRSAVARFPGTVGVFAKNLTTGETYSIAADESVRTASTIKLPVMVEVFTEVAAGTAKWDETIELKEADKVSGSGVLTEFSPGLRFPIRDLLHLMIVVSDNTATNLLLDRVTADAVNARMDALGFPRTRALRKVLGDGATLKPPSGISAAGRLEENKRFGLGVSTPREMVLLLEKIDRGEVVSPEASREMIEILKRQQYKDGIGRRLGEMPVASKSGALDRLRSDVGIVYAPGGKLAIAITCDGLGETDYSPDNAANIFIADLTRMLMEGLLP